MQFENTVTIAQPAAVLYSYWRDFANLPRFMKHLKEVKVQDNLRSHWVTSAPLGTTVEWDAQIVEEKENEFIAWKSLEGAQIENSGSVSFKAAPGDRGTEVKVITDYNPPGGIIGDAIAKLFGENPKQQLGDELNRFKMLMEAGEIATTEGQPKGN